MSEHVQSADQIEEASSHGETGKSGDHVEEGTRAGSRHSDIDGGWAHVVTVGALLCSGILDSVFKMQGLLYLGFLDIFREGPIITSWIGSALALSFAASGLVTGFLCDRMSLRAARWVTVGSGAAMGVVTAGAGWMPSIAGVIVIFGIVGGALLGAVSVISVRVHMLFYDRLKFAASGVRFSAGPLFALIMPPIFTYSVSQFSLRGAMVVLGGICLHLIVTGITMVDSKEVTDRIAASRQGPGRKLTQKPIHLGDHKIKETPRAINSDQNALQENNGASKFTQYKSSYQTSEVEAAGKDNPAFDNDDPYETERTEQRGHTYQVESKHVAGHGCCKSVLLVLRDLWTTSTLPGLPTLIALNFTASFACFGQYFLFATLADELGASDALITAVVAAPSATDICCRLVGGFLVDKYHLDKYKILLFSFIVTFVLGIVMSFIANAWVLLAYTILFGFFGGAFFPMMMPMMVEVVPPSAMGTASGLFNSWCCLGIFCGPPIFGLLRSRTGSFFPSLQLCACAFLPALCFLLVHRHAHCRRASSSAVQDTRL